MPVPPVMALAFPAFPADGGGSQEIQVNLDTSVRSALALLLAAIAGPALGQQAPAQNQPAAITISPKAAKALQELQAAVNANDAVNIPARLAAAQAAAQTPQDRYAIGQLQLKAANAVKNPAGVVSALEAMLATGVAPQDRLPAIYSTLADAHLQLKQDDKAATALERLIALQPANLDAKLMLADTRKSQGRTAEAIALIQAAIAARTASGQKAKESWYKQAVALAYEKKLPTTLDLSRDWLAAYPTKANWRDALRIYRKLTTLDDAGMLDVLRLARVAGGMEEPEYSEYAYAAIVRRYPGEARSVLEEGVAAGLVDRSKAPFAEMIAEAARTSVAEAASVDAAAKDGLVTPKASAALRMGDLLYGYGRYAEAAEIYRAGLGRSGADPSLMNLHLGMALARAGDKAGATAALKAVSGARAELAKFWLAYLASRS